jgi:hypothetical protein
VTASCPGINSVILRAELKANSQSFVVKGCNFALTGTPLTGATVVIDGGTYVTGSDGTVTMPLANGTYPYTISMPPRFASHSGSVTMSACSPVLVDTTLTPATGYVCFSCAGGYAPELPIKKTLSYSETYYGLSGTATYDATTGSWNDPSSLAGAPAHLVNVPVDGTCIAQSGVGWWVRFKPCPSGSFVQYDGFAITGCAKTHPGATTPTPGLTGTSAGFSPNFVATFTGGPNHLYPGTPTTLTLFE